MHRLLPLALLSFSVVAPCQTVDEVLALQRTRAVWFVENDNPIGAEVGLSYETVPWDEAAKTAWTAGPGARIALATKAWAEFATFTDLQFGAVKVKGGSYYAVLERQKEGMALGLLDATKVRALQVAPGTAKGLPLVASIPLVSQGGLEGPLRAQFVPDPKGGGVTLQLQWGTETLSATATVKDSKGASPIALPDPRQASRVSWPGKEGRVPMATIDHGVLPWNDGMKERADGMRVGQRWRMGKDWATTLDTNTPLIFGDKKLAPGLWHLTMEKTKAGWSLAISNAAEDYAGKLDGFAADHVRPVVVAPLQEDTDRIKTSDLLVLFRLHDGQPRIVVACCGLQYSLPVALGK